MGASGQRPPLFPGTLQTLVLSPKPSQSAILQWLFITISFIHSTGIYWARLSTMLKRYQDKSSPSLRGTQILPESCPWACELRGACFLLTPQQSHSVRGFLQTLTSLHFLLSLSFSKQGFMKVQFLRSRHWTSFAGCAHEYNWQQLSLLEILLCARCDVKHFTHVVSFHPHKNCTR